MTQHESLKQPGEVRTLRIERPPVLRSPTPEFSSLGTRTVHCTVYNFDDDDEFKVKSQDPSV
jgi:hypothetical protein